MFAESKKLTLDSRLTHHTPRVKLKVLIRCACAHSLFYTPRQTLFACVCFLWGVDTDILCISSNSPDRENELYSSCSPCQCGVTKEHLWVGEVRRSSEKTQVSAAISEATHALCISDVV